MFPPTAGAAIPVTSRAALRTPIVPQRHTPSPPDPASPSADSVGSETFAVASIEERDPDFRRKIGARDRDALGRFYEIFFERVYGYVRRMLGTDSLAEDVTQDVFMHIQRSITTYDPARELAPWVFTIASNKVRDHWRSRAHQDALKETSLDADDDPSIEPATHGAGPLPAMEAGELKATLDQAVDGLSPTLRETLVLRWFEGLPFEEIGRMIGRNETAVRKRYSRALAELRAGLERRVGSHGRGIT